jgi:hypothetical protein
LEGYDELRAIERWREATDYAITRSTYLHETGVTKQLCNRLLEPFMWHTALITATEWENFFALRCPQYEISIDDQLHVFRSQKDVIRTFGLQSDMTDEYFLRINKGQGEIHIMKLAEMIWDAMNESKPKELKAGEWHIPFGDAALPEDLIPLAQQRKATENDLRLAIATARCAQTSYTVIGDGDKPMDYAKLIALHDRLATSSHWSPFEHCAKAMTDMEYCGYVRGIYPTTSDEWGIVNYERYPFITKPMFPDEEPRIGWNQSNPDIYGWCGNFRGWIQYRKMFPNENHTQ